MLTASPFSGYLLCVSDDQCIASVRALRSKRNRYLLCLKLIQHPRSTKKKMFSYDAIRTWWQIWHYQKCYCFQKMIRDDIQFRWQTGFLNVRIVSFIPIMMFALMWVWKVSQSRKWSLIRKDLIDTLDIITNFINRKRMFFLSTLSTIFQILVSK